MRGMNSNCVDLIYLAPPFNGNRNYAAPIGSEAAMVGFKDTWTIDHIIPSSRGGTDHIDNLQLLCGACNSVKSNGSNEEFLVKLRGMGLR